MLGHTIEEAHAFAHLAEFLMDRINLWIYF